MIEKKFQLKHTKLKNSKLDSSEKKRLKISQG